MQASAAGATGAGASAGHSTEQSGAHIQEGLAAVFRICAVLLAAAPSTHGNAHEFRERFAETAGC